MNTPQFSLPPIHAELMRNFLATYDLQEQIIGTDTKTFLGNKSPRICRFCGKFSPEVKFKKEAHALPRFMGNRNLLSYFECDTCNGLFSAYEDSFANYIGVDRTINGIKGRQNKPPKFKDFKTGLEVEVKDNAIHISVKEDSEEHIVDLENKLFSLSTARLPYTPIHIIKILIKIGLTLLPENELSDYDIARKIILYNEKDAAFKGSKMLTVYGYWYPGPPKFSTSAAELWTKKDTYPELVPQKQLILYYGNYVFQMALPFGTADMAFRGQEISVPRYPLMIDQSFLKDTKGYKHADFDFTSSHVVKGDGQTFEFAFGETKELPLEDGKPTTASGNTKDGTNPTS